MAHIVEHLSVEELEARHRAAQDATEARHLQAIWLLAQGRTFLEVAEGLAFVPRWVEQLAARHNASGPEAPGDQRRRNGRPASLMTPALMARLPDARPRRAAAGRPPAPEAAGRPGRAAEAAAGGRRGVERPRGGGLDGAAPRPG